MQRYQRRNLRLRGFYVKLKYKAIGEQGSWFAEVNGARLPCIHNYWLKRLHYCDPGVRPGEKQWDEFIAAIQAGGEVILTNSSPNESGIFERKGYICAWKVSPPQVTENGLEFDLISRDLELA